MMSRFKKWQIAWVLAAVLLVAPAVWALDWHTANQSTIAWDAVTTDANGDPIPGADERITYVVYLANAQTDPTKANPTEVGTTQNTQLTITLNTKGQFFVGIKSMIETGNDTDGWIVASESAVAWSDDPQFAQGGATFGLRFYPAPSAPGGLRPV